MTALCLQSDRRLEPKSNHQLNGKQQQRRNAVLLYGAGDNKTMAIFAEVRHRGPTAVTDP